MKATLHVNPFEASTPFQSELNAFLAFLLLAGGLGNLEGDIWVTHSNVWTQWLFKFGTGFCKQVISGSLFYIGWEQFQVKLRSLSVYNMYQIASSLLPWDMLCILHFEELRYTHSFSMCIVVIRVLQNTCLAKPPSLLHYPLASLKFIWRGAAKAGMKTSFLLLSLSLPRDLGGSCTTAS